MESIKSDVSMGWEMIRLGNVCDVLGGYAFKSENFKNEGIPLLRISNITNGEVSFKDDCVCVEDSNLDSLQRFKVIKGDILLALSGATTGKFGVYKLNDFSFLNQRVGLIRPTEKMDQKYLLYYLNILKSQIEQVAQGAAQPNISTNEISNLLIPFPPLPIQKRIADILDAADALKRKDQELLKKYDELAQAIFIDMFGDPLKNEKGWEVKKLSDVCLKIADIDHNMPKEVENGLPFISAKDLKDDGTISFENVKKISVEDFTRLSRKIKPELNDIIYSRIGAKLGKARKVRTDISFIASYSCCTIKPNTDLINTDFLCYFLDSPFCLNEVLKKVRSIGVPDLGMDEVREIKVLFPPKKNQEEFCKAINMLELSCNSLRNQFSSNLFQTLIQKAFNGELVN